MPATLDHLFVMTRRGAPEAERLLRLGFAEGSRNVHHGQGTANRRFFFANAMLELLWVEDEDEARSATIAPTGLFERFHHRRTGASPFGICLRGEPLPFAAWPYRPPYLPPNVSIPVARTTLEEPMLFAIPFGGRPDAFPADRREPLDHPAGVREITGVRLTLAEGPPLSPALRALDASIASFARGPGPVLELSFDGATRGTSWDLRPDLPIVLHA